MSRRRIDSGVFQVWGGMWMLDKLLPLNHNGVWYTTYGGFLNTLPKGVVSCQ